MIVVDTCIPDVKLLEPHVFGDDRGFFMETFRENWFRDNVANVRFVQDNHSRSRKGVLRGLHYQTQQPQGKLVRVVSGEVYDVAVDIRRDSPTFGQWYGCHLSEMNKKQLWVPPGLAHGFLVISEMAEFVYKCTDYYHPQSERSVRWDDPQLAIEWPLAQVKEILVSDKDQSGLSLAEAVGLID